ncbi:hypothetical protein EVG20_g8914 [Dentipellis fragilis]|uniref:Uncharacterized protein n=1 Tax=Dentipellis fragilis TaxID=205917 RepID=A0A4Y9Y4F1_9AGAM|nr:hypothetical protein EVG20_g8914 [Dentipellis fragilis]
MYLLGWSVAMEKVPKHDGMRMRSSCRATSGMSTPASPRADSDDVKSKCGRSGSACTWHLTFAKTGVAAILHHLGKLKLESAIKDGRTFFYVDARPHPPAKGDLNADPSTMFLVASAEFRVRVPDEYLDFLRGLGAMNIIEH